MWDFLSWPLAFPSQCQKALPHGTWPDSAPPAHSPSLSGSEHEPVPPDPAAWPPARPAAAVSGHDRPQAPGKWSPYPQTASPGSKAVWSPVLSCWSYLWSLALPPGSFPAAWSHFFSGHYIRFPCGCPPDTGKFPPHFRKWTYCCHLIQ